MIVYRKLERERTERRARQNEYKLDVYDEIKDNDVGSVRVMFNVK